MDFSFASFSVRLMILHQGIFVSASSPFLFFVALACFSAPSLLCSNTRFLPSAPALLAPASELSSSFTVASATSFPTGRPAARFALFLCFFDAKCIANGSSPVALQLQSLHTYGGPCFSASASSSAASLSSGATSAASNFFPRYNAPWYFSSSVMHLLCRRADSRSNVFEQSWQQTLFVQHLFRC